MDNALKNEPEFRIAFWGKEVIPSLHDALKIFVTDEKIKKFLLENDKKAFEQAEKALKGSETIFKELR